MKKIGILGASGSVGTQALNVIRSSETLELEFFSVHSSVDKAKAIIDEFHPAYCIITNKDVYSSFNGVYSNTTICYKDDLEKVIQENKVDMVLNSVTGIFGLLYTHMLVKNKVDVALANKESLVSYGREIMRLSKKNNVSILPVDSELSAIWQSLNGEDISKVKRISLTASGGAFRDLTREQIVHKKASEALKHPNWSMGAKITIDSATLINKGFEMIETAMLFDLPIEKMEPVIHRESYVHSAVHFIDGSVIAQIGQPSMELPIEYALLRKNRVARDRDFSFAAIAKMHFSEVDNETFYGINLARLAYRKGDTYPAVFNAANDAAVYLYLRDKIAFYDIEEIIRSEFDKHHGIVNARIDDIVAIQQEVYNKIKERY